MQNLFPGLKKMQHKQASKPLTKALRALANALSASKPHPAVMKEERLDPPPHPKKKIFGEKN